MASMDFVGSLWWKITKKHPQKPIHWWVRILVMLHGVLKTQATGDRRPTSDFKKYQAFKKAIGSMDFLWWIEIIFARLLWYYNIKNIKKPYKLTMKVKWICKAICMVYECKLRLAPHQVHPQLFRSWRLSQSETQQVPTVTSFRLVFLSCETCWRVTSQASERAKTMQILDLPMESSWNWFVNTIGLMTHAALLLSANKRTAS